MNPGTPITFDSNNLQTSNIVVAQIDHGGITSKDAKVYQFNHSNGSIIPFVGYPNRTITVTGKIYGSTIADLDSRLDTFNAYFNGQDKNLDIGYGNSTRRYIATLAKMALDRPNNLSFANFTLTFVCTRPFGRNTSQTTILNTTGITASSRSDAYTFAGSAPYQYPIFTITYTAITGGTAKAVTVGNNNNGQAITVTRDWTAGDVLQIDSVNRTVTINGFTVDYTGAFPEFPPGAQSIGYNDALTSRTFNYDIVYSVMYL